MEEVVNFLGGLNNGCAARQELPWVDSPRQASTGPARTVLSPRLKVAGEKFLRSPDRPHTLFFSEKMASTRIFSPKCLKILTPFKFLFFICKTTDIFFGHFRLFHGREKQFSIFLDFYVENPSFQRPLNFPTLHNEVKKQSPPLHRRML